MTQEIRLHFRMGFSSFAIVQKSQQIPLATWAVQKREEFRKKNLSSHSMLTKSHVALLSGFREKLVKFGLKNQFCSLKLVFHIFGLDVMATLDVTKANQPCFVNISMWKKEFFSKSKSSSFQLKISFMSRNEGKFRKNLGFDEEADRQILYFYQFCHAVLSLLQFNALKKAKIC